MLTYEHPEHRPFLVRGDCGFGNDTVLREMEARQQPYLFKLKQSKNVRRLLVRYIVDRILASAQAVRQNQPALPATAAG